MCEDDIDHKEYLFEQLEMVSEFKRVKNKNYGWIKCKPNSLIGVIVRKKNVTVEFITEGKKNDLGSDVFLAWVVKSGILKKELANGKKFELNEGTKNKNKVFIAATMGIQKEEDLSERNLITFCEDTMILLLGETEGFLEVKPQASSASEDDDDDDDEDYDDDDDYVSPMSKYIDSIRDELDSIIDNNSEEFKSSKSFKVRPGIAYDKFYLDRVAGSYDQSLQGLIHHMMWERKHYHEILPESQVSVVAKVIKEEPDGIYGPDYDDESISEEECEELDDNIKAIYFDVIKHVGQRLKEFDFFDNSEFEDGGYVDEDLDYCVQEVVMSKKWSSSLIEATARSLQDIGSVNPMDGCLHLKCIDGKYGTITATNLTKGHFEIEIKSSEDKLLFESADKMIVAGWAID